MTNERRRRICYKLSITLTLALIAGLILHWAGIVPAIPTGTVGTVLAAIIVLTLVGRDVGKADPPAWAATLPTTQQVQQLLAAAEVERLRREMRTNEAIEDVGDSVRQMRLRVDSLADLELVHGGRLAQLADQQAMNHKEIGDAFCDVRYKLDDRDALIHMRIGKMERDTELRAAKLERLIREQHADVAAVKEVLLAERAELRADLTDAKSHIDHLAAKVEEMVRKIHAKLYVEITRSKLNGNMLSRFPEPPPTDV